MAPTLLIRLFSDGAAEWLALGRDGRVLAGPQAGLPAEAAEQTVVVVPAEHVLRLRAPRVAKQRRQLLQAMPYAIEEQLAAPVEQLHVALDDRPGDDVAVAVVARARLDGWLASLRAAGIEADHLRADSDLLPDDAARATLLVDGERALLRHGDVVLAGSADEVDGWFAWLRAEGRLPERLHWIGPASTAPDGIEIESEPGSAPLRWLAAQWPRAAGVELLQGSYAPRRKRDSARRAWRIAAALAALGVLASLGQLWLERAQLQSLHAAQRAEMEQLLRGALPGVTRVVDPKAQLAAEFARLGRGGGSGALPLLAKIAPSLAGSGRYTIDGLEFRGDTLELVIRGADIAALDSLRETLAAHALQVELTGANPGAGGVEGRLRIRSGG